MVGSAYVYNREFNTLHVVEKAWVVKTYFNCPGSPITLTSEEKAEYLKKSYSELLKSMNLSEVNKNLKYFQNAPDEICIIGLDATVDKVKKWLKSKGYDVDKMKIEEDKFDYKAEHKKMNDLARKAQEKYYNDPNGQTIMTDSQYDALYNKIEELENKYNYHPKDSVTQTTGIKETKISKGGKVKHEFPCLSQSKIKHDPDQLANWLGKEEGILSLKEDGNTLVLVFDGGTLTQAATRGDGIIGQDVTNIIKTQNAIPKYIADKGHVVLRGEFLITFNEFKKINSNLQNGEQPYKNPRNLSAGLLHQQDLNIAKSRQGIFNVFELVKCTDFDKLKTYEDHLKWCLKQGFNIVQYIKVNKSTVKSEIDNFEKKIIPGVDHPVDGLVCRYNDNKLVALGYNNHAPKFSIAYKFVDEIVPTTLKTIQWQASRTGRINPVAIFDPIELEGTTVQRCTLNNLSFIKDKLGNPYVGQEIYIKKNNMIIPGIDETYTKPNKIVTTNLINIPKVCPSCGKPTKIIKDGIAEFLICENPDCNAKNSKKLELFAGKSAMDLDGISSATIKAFIEAGLLKTFSDFYDLPNHKDELFELDGFGQRSYDNLVKVLDKSKNIEPYRLLLALGIENVGANTAKDICKHFNNQFPLIIRASAQDYMQISGIGSTVANSMEKWFRNPDNMIELNKLLNIISFKQPAQPIKTGNKLSGKTFAATGKLENFTRKSIEESVIANGGTWIGAVNKNLQYLINNDINSASSKNVKAKQLGVNIITEQDYLEMIK